MIKTTLPTVGLGLLLSQALFSQVTIFDTTNGMTLQTLTVSAGEEVADDVSLATMGATVTGLELFLVTFSAAGSIDADVTAALYSPNGTGAPATLLWSETKAGLNFTSTESSVVFSNIDTSVDQAFFWSVRMDNVVADAEAIWGPRLSVAANVAPSGTSTDPGSLYIDPDGSGFLYTTVTGADSTLGVRITGNAIPEPGTTLALLLGAVSLAARRRPRTS